MARLVLCTLIVAIMMPAVARASVKVVLRYDDYSSFQTDPRIIVFEQALFQGVQDLRGHLIVGVIPFPGMQHPESEVAVAPVTLPLRDDKRQLLKRYVNAGAVTLAIHGYKHGDSGMLNGIVSEFAGLPQAKQEMLLRSAKRALLEATGIEARVFVPPFNQYDRATLRALGAVGFDVLSAGRRALVNDAELAELAGGGSLSILPGTVQPRSLKRAVTAAMASGSKDSLVVATLHPYDFSDTGMPMPGFRSDAPLMLGQWLEELKSVAAMDGVRLVSPQQLRDAREDLTLVRLEANSSIRDGVAVRHRLLPEWTGLYPADGVYFGAKDAQGIRSMQLFVLVGGVVLVLLATLLPTTFVLRRFGATRPWLGRVSKFVGLLGIAAVSWHTYAAQFLLSSLTVLVVSLGLLCAAIAVQLRSGQLAVGAKGARAT